VAEIETGTQAEQGSWIHLSIKTDQFLWISINRSGFIDSEKMDPVEFEILKI
jgi:hypothetical protein